MTKALVLASGLLFALGGASYADDDLDLLDVTEETWAALSMFAEVEETEGGDDELVEAVISPVPLPAAGWMLLAGLGGIAVLRRRAKA